MPQPSGCSGASGYEGIKVFSETDQTEGLKAISVPVLVLHCDDDQIAPCDNASVLSVKLLATARRRSIRDCQTACSRPMPTCSMLICSP